MAAFTPSVDLRGAEFIDVDLRGVRFVEANLSGVVMRGVQMEGADIDAPWLFDGESVLRVNGVDVIPFVEAELNRRFPGRADRRAADPDGLRAAWAALERTWSATLDRAAAMPAGAVDESVDGEWSFAQTLRHLVLATDMWLGRAILEIEQPFHPIGIRPPGTEDDGFDTRRPGRSGRLACPHPRADRAGQPQLRRASAAPPAQQLLLRPEPRTAPGGCTAGAARRRVLRQSRDHRGAAGPADLGPGRLRAAGCRRPILAAPSSGNGVVITDMGDLHAPAVAPAAG